MLAPAIELRTPMRAWVVVFAGMCINLCLGILYAWSIWKANLIANAQHAAGTAMSGLNEGWIYLTDAQATWAYAICGITFAIFMIPGGLLQDRLGPRLGATLGGVSLGSGCVLAGLGRSYETLIAGFGVLGGIGMGLGYAAATPAAVKWFGPQRRGLVSGLVVGGYGAAAIYIAPLAKNSDRQLWDLEKLYCFGNHVRDRDRYGGTVPRDARRRVSACFIRQGKSGGSRDATSSMDGAIDARNMAILCDAAYVHCVGAGRFACDRERCTDPQ